MERAGAESRYPGAGLIIKKQLNGFSERSLGVYAGKKEMVAGPPYYSSVTDRNFNYTGQYFAGPFYLHPILIPHEQK